MTARKTTLVLRTRTGDMTSYGGFRWPEKGPVSAPDWKPNHECGHGLHGLANGVGDGGLLDWSEDARWLVVKTATADLVDLGGKVKFPKGTVVYCGDRPGAAAYLDEHGVPADQPVVGATRTAGDGGTATAGDRGTATAGDRGALVIHFYDAKRGVSRVRAAEVGEDGILPATPYRLDADGRFVEVVA